MARELTRRIPRWLPARARWAIALVGLSVLGLGVGVAAASMASGPPDPPPAAAQAAAQVAATRAIAAPDKALLPPGVPSAPLAKGASLASDATVVRLDRLVVTVVDSRCDVEVIVAWSRPGGQAYCVVSVTYATTGKDPVLVTAVNQLVYGMPAYRGAPGGYQGTFLLDEAKIPAAALTIQPGKTTNVLIAFDVQRGFVASQFVPQAS